MASECLQGAVAQARRARLQHFQEARAKLNQQFALSVPKPETDASDTRSSETAFWQACDAGVLMTEQEMQLLLVVAVRRPCHAPQMLSHLHNLFTDLICQVGDRKSRVT